MQKIVGYQHLEPHPADNRYGQGPRARERALTKEEVKNVLWTWLGTLRI